MRELAAQSGAANVRDGSWYVGSRSPKLQPYFQSGLPYEHDQWISAAARAVMAMAPAAAPQTRATR